LIETRDMERLGSGTRLDTFHWGFDWNRGWLPGFPAF
jgi:hypothetical protein